MLHLVLLFYPKEGEFEFLSIALTIMWFALFAISFFGGIYYSELTLLVTFIIAASLMLKKKGVQVEAKN